MMETYHGGFIRSITPEVMELRIGAGHLRRQGDDLCARFLDPAPLQSPASLRGCSISPPGCWPACSTCRSRWCTTPASSCSCRCKRSRPASAGRSAPPGCGVNFRTGVANRRADPLRYRPSPQKENCHDPTVPAASPRLPARYHRQRRDGVAAYLCSGRACAAARSSIAATDRAVSDRLYCVGRMAGDAAIDAEAVGGDRHRRQRGMDRCQHRAAVLGCGDAEWAWPGLYRRAGRGARHVGGTAIYRIAQERWRSGRLGRGLLVWIDGHRKNLVREKLALENLLGKRPALRGGRFCDGDLGSAVAVQKLAVRLRASRLAVQLFGLRRLLFGFLLSFALGLVLQAQFFSPRLGALLLALLFAGVAFAADRLQIGLEVVGAVIVVDLFTRLDLLDGADHHPALARADVGFRVRLAGVIDIARDVLAHRAVDGPAPVQFEQILVLDGVVFFLPGIQQRPKIADDLGALLDRLGGEEAKPGAGAADAIRFLRGNGRHDRLRTDASEGDEIAKPPF